MKKILAFLLAALMIMSFAACGNKNDSKVTEAPTETPTEAPVDEETEPVIVDSASISVSYTETKEISFFMLSISYSNGTNTYLMAYPNEDGTAYVDMNAEIIKKGNVNGAAMTAVLDALEASGLKELESVADDAYSDEASLSINFYSGTPEAFDTGYATMLTCFQELTADLEVYVPKPAEYGDIADSDRAALDGILAKLENMDSLDNYGINGFAKDEYFATSMGLTSDAGVVSGLQFSHGSSSVAYALFIVTVEDAANTQAVAADFEANINWGRWICVMPENAYIATKGNNVVMLLGSLGAYEDTVAAIEADGWTAYKALNNPDM